MGEWCSIFLSENVAIFANKKRKTHIETGCLLGELFTGKVRKKGKGSFYSAVSSPLDCSKRFTLAVLSSVPTIVTSVTEIILMIRVRIKLLWTISQVLLCHSRARNSW